MTSPVQAALRELMFLTKCYCDGQHPHPRLGNNCSFRPDVERVVKAISDALVVCKADAVADRAGWQVAYDIRRTLLGTRKDTPERPWEACSRCNYDTHTCPGCGESLRHGVEVCDECSRSEEDAPHAARIAQTLQHAALRQKEGIAGTAR